MKPKYFWLTLLVILILLALEIVLLHNLDPFSGLYSFIALFTLLTVLIGSALIFTIKVKKPANYFLTTGEKEPLQKWALGRRFHVLSREELATTDTERKISHGRQFRFRIDGLPGVEDQEVRDPDVIMDEYLVAVIKEEMGIKLSKKRRDGRGGWWNESICSVDLLRQLLEEHLTKGDMIDVINLAAMIYAREAMEMRNENVI